MYELAIEKSAGQIASRIRDNGINPREAAIRCVIARARARVPFVFELTPSLYDCEAYIARELIYNAHAATPSADWLFERTLIFGKTRTRTRAYVLINTPPLSRTLLYTRRAFIALSTVVQLYVAITKVK